MKRHPFQIKYATAYFLTTDIDFTLFVQILLIYCFGLHCQYFFRLSRLSFSDYTVMVWCYLQTLFGDLVYLYEINQRRPIRGYMKETASMAQDVSLCCLKLSLALLLEIHETYYILAYIYNNTS